MSRESTYCILSSLAIAGVTALALALHYGVPAVAPLTQVFRVDTLSTFFILNTCLVSIAASASSPRYISIYSRGSPAAYFTALCVFATSMALIPMVRNWLYFLFLWEVMTLSSYVLTIYGYRGESLKAGRDYFIVMHVLDTTPLVLMVAFLRASAGTFTFTQYGSALRDAILITALIGFGTKAGLFPLHFWLPEAHPAAPSPVSAMLSGSMVELGIYGLFRVAQLSATGIPSYYPWLLAGLGVLSMLSAILMYAVQSDAKRLFAWSTIDNIGWMTIVMTCSLLGFGRAAVTLLGIYVLCHGLAKASAFISSGGFIYTLGTKDLRKVRGVLTACPALSYLTLFSMMALEGVPPFNLFISRLNVLEEAFKIHPALAVFAAVEWCIAFIIFLSIIHKYLLTSEGEARAVRRLPRGILGAVLFLLTASLLIYPVMSVAGVPGQ